MTPPDDDDAYEVGYKKPPKHTRFQSGRSGNPKGRPKGALNFNTTFEQVWSERLSAVVQGRSRKRSSLELALRQNRNKAVQGDARALMLALATMQRTGIGMAEPQIAAATPSSADDEALIARALAALEPSTDKDPETGS